MRAYVDTNVYISYLLSQDSTSPPTRVILAGIAGKYTLLTSEIVISELRDKIANKPYLSARISGSAVEEFVELFRTRTEIVTGVPTDFPMISRDRDDDFHIMHAVLGHADYLVAGDHDLQVLGDDESVRIVSQAEFVQILGL